MSDLVSDLVRELDDDGADERTVGQILADAAMAWPEGEAVVMHAHGDTPEIRWTFAALDRQATQLANALAATYPKGSRVAVWSPNSAAWILLEWACARAGLVLVTLDPVFTPAELARGLAAADVVAVFHAAELKRRPLRPVVESVRTDVPTLVGIHTLDELLDGDRLSLDWADGIDPTGLPDVDPRDPFLILYSSGTTGTPKAAVLSHYGSVNTSRDIHRRWSVGRGERIAHGFALFHVGGASILTIGPALTGASTHPLHIFEPGLTIDVLEGERCSAFLGVPTMYLKVLDGPGTAQRDLTSLRFLVAGGAALPDPLVERIESGFGAPLLNVFGQTESSGLLASAHPDESREIRTHTVGRALAGCRFKVVGAGGETLPLGEPGEICYQGRGLFLGYLNESPDEPPAVDDDGWLHTGDTGTLDDTGRLRIVGRKKEMVIRGGENLFPAEIEATILELPAVAQVCVVGVPDDRYGEELCAAVVLADGSDADGDAVRDHCAARLSRWKVPRYVVVREALPMTGSGKVRRVGVRDEVLEVLGLDGASRRG